MRESELAHHVRVFAATISRQALGLVRHREEGWGQVTRCFENAKRKVQEAGGKVKYGWIFQHRLVGDVPGPGYLIAIHHAVWHAPNGRLIDVTPYHHDPKYHPLAPGGSVLFLVDDRAEPVVTDELIAPLPSQFLALSNEQRIVSHVQGLRREEEQECRKIYSGKCPPFTST